LLLFCETVLQAYTSQFVALVMFGLVMCEDRISMQSRRREIIQGLRKLPGVCACVRAIFVTLSVIQLTKTARQRDNFSLM